MRTPTTGGRRPSASLPAHPGGTCLAPSQGTAASTVPQVSSPPAPSSRRERRRAQRRPPRPGWDRFGIAIGVTAVLVLAFGAGPFELNGGAARPEVAAAVHAVETDDLTAA